MKKTTLSIVSILALSGLAFAGVDIAPIGRRRADNNRTKSILYRTWYRVV